MAEVILNSPKRGLVEVWYNAAMIASQSGDLVAQANSTLIFLKGLGIGTVGGGLAGFFFQQLIAEFFGNRRRKSIDKRSLADEVIKICTEASVNNYTTKSRKEEHVFYIMNQLAAVDTKATKYLEELVSSWLYCSSMPSPSTFVRRGDYQADYAFMIDQQKRAIEKSEALLKIVYKWKN
jgi:hypothetical protein